MYMTKVLQQNTESLFYSDFSKTAHLAYIHKQCILRWMQQHLQLKRAYRCGSCKAGGQVVQQGFNRHKRLVCFCNHLQQAVCLTHGWFNAGTAKWMNTMLKRKQT